MAVSKVVYDGKTLIDLTGDTVNPETLVKGTTAHDMAGNAIVGIMEGVDGDLVDVSELPSVVDDSKIYRKEGQLNAICYIATDYSGAFAVYEIGQALSRISGTIISINYELVDELPERGNPFTGSSGTVYVVKSTSIGYVYNSSVWLSLSAFARIISGDEILIEDKGEISSSADIKEQGVYTVYTQKTVIGIPNKNQDKEATFWNGTEWGLGGKVVVINGGNLPEVGVEGTIYFRNNVPCLMTKIGDKITPYIEGVLLALGGTRCLEINTISSIVPTHTPVSDGVSIPVYYVTNGTGYSVYWCVSGSWDKIGDFGRAVNDNSYITFRNEVWYFRGGKYVRISTNEFASEIIGELSGLQYTGDLYAVNIPMSERDWILEGISGEVKASKFIYDDWGDYTRVRTGALAGCTGVTSIESFEVSDGGIGAAAFYGCTGLTTVDISADSIGAHAFYGCTNLQSVYVYSPDIGEYAFANCTALTDIHFNGTKAKWNAGTFGRGWNENTGNYTVHCTDGDIAKS